MKFGETLRRMRKDRKLSQDALAEKAGLASDYLGFIERGDNVPTLTVLLKLARALGVDGPGLLSDFDAATIRKLKL
jgi:transcriptional regulator with XRE-family HTH domain